MGNKTTSYQKPDLLNGNPEYGVLIFEVELEDPPNLGKDSLNQLVLEFPDLPPNFGIVLSQNHLSFNFLFKIPFSRESFKKYFDELHLMIHFNNSSDSSYDADFVIEGCSGAIICSISQVITLQNSKTKGLIQCKVSFTFIGDTIIKELCSLSSHDLMSARNNLMNFESIYDLFDSKNVHFFSDDHLASLHFFASQESFNNVLMSFVKHEFQEEEQSVLFLKYTEKCADFLYEVDVTNFRKLMFIGYESSRKNYRQAFFRVIEIVKKKTGSLKPFFKNIVDLELSLENLNYYEHKNQIVEDFFVDSWLFDNFLIQEIQIQTDGQDASNLLKLLIQNYEKEIDSYLLKFREEIEKKMNIPEKNKYYYYLKNFVETPEYHILKLKVLTIYENNEPYDGPEIQHLVNINGPAYRIQKQKNIVIISEHAEKRRMYISHAFMMELNLLYIVSAKKAIFFLSETIPDISNFQKFYDLEEVQYKNGTLPYDEVLTPIGFIDGQVNCMKAQYLSGLELGKIASGNVFSAIILEGSVQGENPQINAIGCFGFIDKESAEKYPVTSLEEPLYRLNIFMKSDNLSRDSKCSEFIGKEIFEGYKFFK